MTFTQFSNIMQVLHIENEKRSAWLNNIPTDISAAFFDNEYVNSLHKVIEFFINQIIPTDLQTDVSWFLYEVNYEHGSNATASDGTRHLVKTLSDFLTLVQIDYTFEEE